MGGALRPSRGDPPHSGLAVLLVWHGACSNEHPPKRWGLGQLPTTTAQFERARTFSTSVECFISRLACLHAPMEAAMEQAVSPLSTPPPSLPPGVVGQAKGHLLCAAGNLQWHGGPSSDAAPRLPCALIRSVA